jgi:hypothetical protein
MVSRGRNAAMHDELKAAAFQEASLDEARLPTFVVPDDVDPGAAAAAATGAALVLGQLADYFGADRGRQLVRLRFSDGVRYLRRSDIYPFLGTSRKGFGDSGHAALPGYSAPGQATDYEFRCPVDGCPDSPVFILAFDEVPLCYRHRVRLELAP